MSVVEGDRGVEEASDVVEFHCWDFWFIIRPVSDLRRCDVGASPLLSGTGGEVEALEVARSASGSEPFWSSSAVAFSMEASVNDADVVVVVAWVWLSNDLPIQVKVMLLGDATVPELEVVRELTLLSSRTKFNGTESKRESDLCKKTKKQIRHLLYLSKQLYAQSIILSVGLFVC